MNHAKLISRMMDWESGCAGRIQHFLKVYELSRTIGILEELDERTQEMLEAAAIVHDIGIRVSLEKYGDGAGKHQELEGPAVARPMLGGLGYDEEIVDRVAWLIAHHHTYDPIEGIDHQILVEADFLVNLFEGNEPPEAIQRVYDRIFRTETGKRFLKRMFSEVL